MTDDALALPLVPPGAMAAPAERSIDEIERWIEEDYARFFDRDIYESEKRALSVDVPFRL